MARQSMWHACRAATIAVACVAGCATQVPRSGGASTVTQPVATSPAEAGPPRPAPGGPSGDYFGEGVHLAALRFASWEDTVFMAKVYPVTITTPASDATKGQAQVKPTITIDAVAKATGDQWSWTPFVFRSHPARKDELKVGQFVLCVDVDYGKSRDELKTAEWRYRRISSVSDLFKGIVEVSYHDTYHHADKTAKVHIDNIRLVDNPLDEGRTAFPQ